MPFKNLTPLMTAKQAKRHVCGKLTYGGSCGQCGKNNQPYMITFELWKEVAKGEQGLLCLLYVEERLGRGLLFDDFLDAPINNEACFGFDAEEWAELTAWDIVAPEIAAFTFFAE